MATLAAVPAKDVQFAAAKPAGLPTAAGQQRGQVAEASARQYSEPGEPQEQQQNGAEGAGGAGTSAAAAGAPPAPAAAGGSGSDGEEGEVQSVRVAIPTELIQTYDEEARLKSMRSLGILGQTPDPRVVDIVK